MERVMRTKTTMAKILWVAMTMGLGMAAARANDGVGGVGMGGIVAMRETDAISMKSEVLEIGWQKIHVAYEFENTTNRDVTLPVVFPLPPYFSDPGFSAMWAGQPRGFSLSINGKRTPFRTHVVADLCFDKTLSCLNVTARLREIGLTDEQIAYFPRSSPFKHKGGESPAVTKLTKLQIATLVSEGLLMEGEDFDDKAWPLWRVSIVYAWNFTFPARSVTKVEHEYAPFGSGGSPHSMWHKDDLDRYSNYCVDDNFKTVANKEYDARAAKAQKDEHTMLPGTGIDYILTTARTWRGPIKSFTLRVKKSRPTELVSFCFQGKARKIDALTFETTIANFDPQNDLSIFFLNISDDNRSWGPYGGNSEAPVLKDK